MKRKPITVFALSIAHPDAFRDDADPVDIALEVPDMFRTMELARLEVLKMVGTLITEAKEAEDMSVEEEKALYAKVHPLSPFWEAWTSTNKQTPDGQTIDLSAEIDTIFKISRVVIE